MLLHLNMVFTTVSFNLLQMLSDLLVVNSKMPPSKPT